MDNITYNLTLRKIIFVLGNVDTYLNLYYRTNCLSVGEYLTFREVE